jgi:hypothetical protein
MSMRSPALALLLSISAQAQTLQPPTIVGVKAVDVTSSNAVLRAKVHPNGGKWVNAWFKWGKTTALANLTPTQVLPGGTNAIVISNLVAGLAPNRTYYFQCVASNKFGVSSSAISSFKTRHDVQFADLTAAAEATEATLRGTFTAQHSGKAWFQWGGSSNVLKSTLPENFASGTHLQSNVLTGLRPNKTYYYQLMASNQFGISGSAVSSFRTKLNFFIEWMDVHVDFYNDPTYVVLHGSIRNQWGATTWFEWGKDTNNPSLTPPVEIYVSHWTPSTILWGLEPNTLYYGRLIATNIYGSESTPWKTFRTPTGLRVTTYPSGPANTYPTPPGYPWGIGAVGSTKARLGAFIANILPPATDAWFEWGTTTNYEHRTEIIASGFGSFEIFTEINGLQEAGAVYHYRAVASNSIGMEFGTNVTFATPLFPIAPVSSNLPGVNDGKGLWCDFDNDGWLDALIAGETTTGAVCQLWRNEGGAFSRAADIRGTARASLVLGDHDNDDKVDLLLGAHERLEIWSNVGSTFSNINAGLPGPHYNQGNSLSWGDYDNDGRLDILVEDFLNLSGTNLGLGVWQNTAEGFRFHSFTQELRYGSVAWGDYDSDGWLDIALKGAFIDYVTPDQHTNAIQLWRNTRLGFTASRSSFTLSQSGSLMWGDYDNDGRLDLVRAGLFGPCQLWRNTGTGFANINAGLPPVGDEWTGATALWGDYDNDGKLDLLVYGYNADGLRRMDPEFICEIWRNTGTGFTNINAGLPGLWNGSATWGDYDNDGRLDVLMTGHKGYWSQERVTQIYRNVHVPANTPPAPPSGLQVLRTDFGVAFTWLPASDEQTPSSGLSYNVRVGSAAGQGDIISPNALPDGRRLLLALGNAQMRRFAYLIGPTNGQGVYWTVQAIDTAFAGGPFAAEQSFVYPPAEAWSPPALSLALSPARLIFNSSLPLPFSIFTSTNLANWDYLAEPSESPAGTYEMLLQPTNSARFFQLRSP